MTWNGTKNWASEPLISGDMDTYISENLDALKTPPSAVYTANESSNYTTVSTSFTNIDGTDTEGKFRHTLVTTGGDVMIGFHSTVAQLTSGTLVYFEITVDGVAHAGDDGICALSYNNSAGNDRQIASFVRLITGLSAGSHIFRLQWKVSAANTATIYAGAGTATLDLHPQFWAREVS
jgi:hypothetical protein